MIRKSENEAIFSFRQLPSYRITFIDHNGEYRTFLQSGRTATAAREDLLDKLDGELPAGGKKNLRNLWTWISTEEDS